MLKNIDSLLTNCVARNTVWSLRPIIYWQGKDFFLLKSTPELFVLKVDVLTTSQSTVYYLRGLRCKKSILTPSVIRDYPQSFWDKSTIGSENPATRNTACNHYLMIYWFVRKYFLKSSVVWMIVKMHITSSNQWYNIRCGKTTYFEHQVRIERACCPVRG